MRYILSYMEKTVNFSVFKEKIIKTNELFSVLLEKNKSLEKSQKWIQHLKTKLELSKNEINTLKLKNETLAFNSIAVGKQYDSLKSEHNNLKQLFSKLETESNDTINSLQMKYQAANQELEECQEKLNFLLESSNTEQNVDLNNQNSPKKKRRSPTKSKKSPVRNKNDSSKLSQKILQLQSEKDRLISEKSDLQLEIYELKKKLSSFECPQEENISKVEIELSQLKNKFKETVESKDQEIIQLSNEIKNIENLKNTLEADNERLKIENSLSQTEISTLERKCTQMKEDFDKTKKKDIKALKGQFTSGEIRKLSEEIDKLQKVECQLRVENEKLKEENVSYKLEISLLQEKTQTDDQNTEIQKAHNISITDLPQIIVNSPTEETTEETEDPTDEEICAIMKSMVVPTRISPLTDQFLCEDAEIQESNDVTPASEEHPKQASSDTNLDLKLIVNRRRKYLKRRKLLARKKFRQIDLYGALVALNKANINFIISNNNLAPSGRDSFRYFNMYHGRNTKFKQTEKPKLQIMQDLSCNLACCKSSCMVLKSGKEGEHLLGFVGVKNEISAQKDSFENNKDRIDKPIVEQNASKDVGSSVDKVNEPEVIRDPAETTNINELTEDVDLVHQTMEIEACHNNIRVDKESNRKVRKKLPFLDKMKRKCCNRYVGGLVRKRKATSVISVIKKKKIVFKKHNLSITQLPLVTDLNLDEANPLVDKITTGENPDKSTEPPIKETSEPDATIKERELPVFRKPTVKPKSPKTTFKRPVCSTRQSLRLKIPDEQVETINFQKDRIEEDIISESPKSPTPESEPVVSETPILIPLEKIPENTEKMATTKIEVLFNKLILFSSEEEALKEVVREFSAQKPDYIAEAILERISLDYHEDPDNKYSPAPLMTDVQRTMFGFMSKLEKTCVVGVFEHYLSLAEERLLTCKSLHELGPITRLYLAICKLQKNIKRMRKLCCDVFYFCGDFAVPFLFTVLTSWTEVLPHAMNSTGFPLAKVWVQIVYTRDCNKPGYNLLPLRDLLIKFYGYPSERWDYNEFFTEIFNAYLKNPSKSTDFALLLYCKSRPEKWVHDRIEEHIKPLIALNIQDNFKATLIILMGNLYSRFSPKSEPNFLPGIREWFSGLITDGTPEVVKTCVYVALSRLKKK